MNKSKKLKINLIVWSIVFVVITTTIFLYSEHKVPILTYHNFATSEERNNFPSEMGMVTSTDVFEQQLQFLKEKDYKTLTMEEFTCWKEHRCKIPRRSVLLTIDDGFLSNYEYAFPLLQKYGMNATVFYERSFLSNVSKNWTGNVYDFMSLDQIRQSQIEYPNIEFYSHSFDLHYPDKLKTMTEQTINQDFENFEKDNITNDHYFAYPYGLYNKEIIKVLEERNYKLAFTFGMNEHWKAKRTDNNYKIPRLNTSGNMDFTKFRLRLIMPF